MLSDGLDSVAASIFWGGLDAYEPGVFRVLAGCLSDLDATAVDIGANTGLFTLFLAGMGFKRVVAFEPVPEICARARRNVAANGFRNVDVFQTAVLDRSGDIRIEVPDVVPVPTSASVKGGFWDTNRSIVVPGTTLDAFFSGREDPAVSFVKIDVEGAALEVLTGMRETIRRWNPVILCEVLPRDALSEIDDLLADCGYRAFCITEEGTVPVESFAAWRFGEWEINFLLVPPGREWPLARDASR
jgi:FkbM family methyltransferase